MASNITITKAEGTWTVRAGGAVLAETTNALRLSEEGHDPVIYFPRTDIAMAFLDPSDTTTSCPHKGEASYFSVVTKSRTLKDSAWSYDTPSTGAEDIKGHLAFYPIDEITIEQI